MNLLSVCYIMNFGMNLTIISFADYFLSDNLNY